MTPTLIGGIGYADLRDHSVGPLLAERFGRDDWPDGTVVEDLSFNPVAVTQRLQAADPPFRRLVLVGAVRRGRRPGSVTAYRWDAALPGAEEVQARVAEAVTGVISLDNLLIVAAALGGLPEETIVVEVEPRIEAMGSVLSPAVREGAERAADLVRAIATDDRTAARVRRAALGGTGAENGGGKHAEVGGAG